MTLATLMWLGIGFLGQFVFFLRFVIQWWVSEKAHQVVIPRAFWLLSIGGTLIIFVYSIHIHDIVFITAQILSLVIYARNLSLPEAPMTSSSVTSDPA